MGFYRTKLQEKLNESLKAVLPIIGIVLFLCFTIAPIPPSILVAFILGAVLLIVGMMFFKGAGFSRLAGVGGLVLICHGCIITYFGGRS